MPENGGRNLRLLFPNLLFFKLRFFETPLSGSFLIKPEPSSDERGYFARIFSAREFAEQGLRGDLTEISISHNSKSRTLRGMHFQKSPYEETKLVRVVRGRAFDVIVDMRKNSATYGQWVAEELSADNGLALYIPDGFAHGFLTLEDHTDILYQITDTFEPAATSGFFWNDPGVSIRWPQDPRIISSRDTQLPHFNHNKNHD